jgi:hypothetical protein
MALFFEASGDARTDATGEAIFWRNRGEHGETPKANNGANR